MLYIWTITDGSYWSVSSWTNKIYLNVTLSPKLLDEHYHRSLTEVITHYHCSINKTYIWRILDGQDIISGDPN